MQFHTFSILHLMATRLLLDRAKGAPIGGYIYPVLKSLGLEREVAAAECN